MQRIHIPVERLSAFADSDNSILTTQEFGHLKVFTACFSTWIEFIRQVVRVSLFDRSQIITWHSGRGVSSSNLSSPGFDKVLQQQDRRTLGRLTPLEPRRNNAECLPLKGRADVAF